jgi:cytochrome c
MASGRIVPMLVAGACFCASPLPPARAEDDPNQAQFLKSCGVCHATEPGAPSRQGQNLAGVYGRKAGKLEGFKFSAALAGADWTWDAASLDKWIENAQAMRPGVVMPYRQADSEKRAKIIEYLKLLKDE